MTRLLLFDDARAGRWAPFTTTRPAGELRYGSSLLRERVEAAFGEACLGHLGPPLLAGWDEPGAPGVLDAASVPLGEDRIVWNSRAVPAGTVELSGASAAGRSVFVVDGRAAGWFLPAGVPLPSPASLGDASHEGASVEVDGEWLDWPWTLVARNSGRLAADLASRWQDDDAGPLAGVVRIGDGVISLAPGATIEPGVTVDTRGGPVRLERNARVEGPGRLVGPVHLGEGCVVFGGSVGHLSAGPVCKLRGEIDGCVLLGFANKAHDGYLGHALVGRWVNLGAATTNSDLKNTYSPVRVQLPDGTEDSGLLKVGVFLGDHSKTGIGTLLTTGAVVGAGSNVFGGGGTPPRHVPPFSWGGTSGLEPHDLARFLETAATVMQRRGQPLTPGVRTVLTRAWQQTHGQT